MTNRFTRVWQAICNAWDPPAAAPAIKSRDPLMKDWHVPEAGELANPILRTIKDFPVYDGIDADPKFAMDSSNTLTKNSMQTGMAPTLLQGWYSEQSFIGYQACAVIAQHWLVDKACSMAAEDAVRNGYEITVQDGTEVDSEVFDRIYTLDCKYNLLENCAQFGRFTNIFGVRIYFHGYSAKP